MSEGLGIERVVWWVDGEIADQAMSHHTSPHHTPTTNVTKLNMNHSPSMPTAHIHIQPMAVVTVRIEESVLAVNCRKVPEWPWQSHSAPCNSPPKHSALYGHTMAMWADMKEPSRGSQMTQHGGVRQLSEEIGMGWGASDYPDVLNGVADRACPRRQGQGAPAHSHIL